MSADLLAGVRVVELGGECAARAGRILADLGAEVVLVEPPGGSPARSVPPLVTTPAGEEVSPHFLYSAAGKRSVTLDRGATGGESLFQRLLQAADVVLVGDDPEPTGPAQVDYDTIRAANEQAVFTRITGFGCTGPRRRWRGSDLVAWASSGGLVTVGDPDRRPVAPGGGLAHAAGALNAVAGTVLALRARRRRGSGQMVDISLQEAVLSVTMESGPFYPLEGGAQVRSGHRRGTGSGHFPAKDGLVELLPFMPGQWDALARWISEDLGIEEATMEVFRGSPLARVPYRELIDGWVEELTGRYTKQEFFLEAQRREIPCGPVNRPVDLLSDPQLAAVDGWVEHDLPGVGALRWPRPPLVVDGAPVGVGPVPGVGEHNSEVYVGVLGLAPVDLDALLGAGAV